MVNANSLTETMNQLSSLSHSNTVKDSLAQER